MGGNAGPRTLAELTVILGPRLGGWPAAASQYLCYPLLGHLERLADFGRVTVGHRGGFAEYSLAGGPSA